jgi:uncharacterized protein (DUF362 family)
MQDVIVSKALSVDPQGRKECLDRALEAAGFFQILSGLPSSTAISIKANIGPASQVAYHYYTDPVLVDHLWDRIEEAGFDDLAIVESETSTSTGFGNADPDLIAPGLGYRHPVTNLTRGPTQEVEFRGHTITLSKRLLRSFTISFAKGKNHDLMWFTGALKNMYGAIPMDKYQAFHHRRSGMDVVDAILAVNLLQTPRFCLIDWIDGVDGNEVCYFSHQLTQHERERLHAHPKRIIAAQGPLETDHFLCRKMGYDPKVMPLLTRLSAEWGDPSYRVVGDSTEPLEGWRRLSRVTHLKAALQDRIPFISNGVVGANIRKYHFDAELFAKDGLPPRNGDRRLSDGRRDGHGEGEV